jgi:hypothetical protein
MDQRLGRPLPVACALFGGYRDDDYTSVLSLHTADFVECFTNLLDLDVKYTIEVKPRLKMGYYNDELITRKRKRARKRMDQEI